MNTVMIIAGESSGELYGSLLAKELKRQWPDLHMLGIGGSRMSEAGVELIARTSDAFGLMEAVSSLRRVRAAFRSAVSALKTYKPACPCPHRLSRFQFQGREDSKIARHKDPLLCQSPGMGMAQGKSKKDRGFRG